MLLVMARAYIGFGANLGDREKNIAGALRLLAESDKIEIEEISSIYETEPVGPVDQPWFLNGVMRIETKLEPVELLRLLKGIEDRLGRKRGSRWGPRTIDFDILLYDEVVMDTPLLTIPHPELEKRKFVLIPLVEISPFLIHPSSGEKMVDLLARVESSPEARLFKKYISKIKGKA